MEGVAVALAVRIPVMYANNQNHAGRQRLAVAGQAALFQAHQHIRFRRRLRVGFFVVALPDREILRENAHRPLDAQGIDQPEIPEKFLQVLHHGVLQKFLCHLSAPP